jgi:hypothetical protein
MSAKHLTLQEATELLRSINHISALDKTPEEIYDGLVYFLADENLIVAYWDAGDFDYIDNILTSDGKFGKCHEENDHECEKWWGVRHNTKGPEDLLTSVEYKKFWNQMDDATIAEWPVNLLAQYKQLWQIP